MGTFHGKPEKLKIFACTPVDKCSYIHIVPKNILTTIDMIETKPEPHKIETHPLLEKAVGESTGTVPNSFCHHHSLNETMDDPDRRSGVDHSLLNYLSMLREVPRSTLSRQLIEDGIELPDPASLSLEAVSEKLWEVIQGLSKRQHYLVRTDHLDDVELYDKLWNEILNQDALEISEPMEGFACFHDLVWDGTAKGTRLYLQYYADEEDRDWWSRETLDEELPPKLSPPENRDLRLPQSPW